ncbi:spore germination protein [Paenibacillus sp. FSL H7-0331]|uniref:spore germination protein n=1 Tax=Paenibacillus sp. FSL H7-0331 TaxID=1920421 RepID=UPI0009FB6B51
MSYIQRDTVILAEGWDRGISASTSKWMQRAVEEPSSQSVIRGPKDGFTENIYVGRLAHVKDLDILVTDKRQRSHDPTAR